MRGGEGVDLEKRIADLEAELQSQQKILHLLVNMLAGLSKGVQANIHQMYSKINVLEEKITGHNCE